MTQSPFSSSNSGFDDASDNEFATTLIQVQTSLDQLKQRYSEISDAQDRQTQLRVQYNRTQNELRRHRTNQLQEELKSIQKQIEELEVVLESQLFRWSSLKEPFWMAVRFGGLGIILGWILHAIANT